MLLERRLSDLLREIIKGVNALQGVPFAEAGYLNPETLEAATILRRLGLCYQAKQLHRAMFRHEDYDAMLKIARELLRLVRERKEFDRDVLSPPQIARLLSTSPDTVLSWIKSGELRASNMAKGRRPRWIIKRSDLDAFLASRQQQPERKAEHRSKIATTSTRFNPK